ncbi:MAG: hypothetical protein CVU53_06755, partial [Deltaproteobacteria bacterium HGW-Deltaproteobacteria-11]
MTFMDGHYTMQADFFQETPLNRKYCLAIAASFVCLCTAAHAGDHVTEQYRTWIQQMKQSERGPFREVLWFCNDGSQQPPVPFGCRDHGGGHQHGQWNTRALALREQSYWIANVLAGIDADEVLKQA